MTNEPHISTATEDGRASFGKRLKNKRDSLGLERKEAANQLRLNEKIIIMMENDQYPADLPITFIRGYLRSYAKLLQVPEFEVNQVLSLIQTQPEQVNLTSALGPISHSGANDYFMQFFTYLIMLTLIGLVGAWWYRHTLTNTTTLVENRQLILPTSADHHPNFGINTAETAAIPSTSATIDKKTQAENIAHTPEQQKLIDPKTPAVIAAASSQKTLPLNDNDDNNEDNNEAE